LFFLSFFFFFFDFFSSASESSELELLLELELEELFDSEASLPAFDTFLNYKQINIMSYSTALSFKALSSRFSDLLKKKNIPLLHRKTILRRLSEIPSGLRLN
jgi:hypothetical protein